MGVALLLDTLLRDHVRSWFVRGLDDIVKARIARGSAASDRSTVEYPFDNMSAVFAADASVALAVVARGIHHQPSNRILADRVTEECRRRVFEPVEELAEIWWRAEPATSARVPRGDREQIRGRVARLLEERIEQTPGDAAVLSALRDRLSGVGVQAFARIEADLLARPFRERAAALATCAIFADGVVAITHVGNARVSRLRRGVVEALTVEHDIHGDWGQERHTLGHLGGHRGGREPSTVSVPIERGDLFLVASHGIAQRYPVEELRDMLLRHGSEAALRLVEGASGHELHPDATGAAVTVEIL